MTASVLEPAPGGDGVATASSTDARPRSPPSFTIAPAGEPRVAASAAADAQDREGALSPIGEGETDGVTGLRAEQCFADRRGRRDLRWIAGRGPAADELVLGDPARVILDAHARAQTRGPGA